MIKLAKQKGFDESELVDLLPTAIKHDLGAESAVRIELAKKYLEEGALTGYKLRVLEQLQSQLSPPPLSLLKPPPLHLLNHALSLEVRGLEDQFLLGWLGSPGLSPLNQLSGDLDSNPSGSPGPVLGGALADFEGE